MASSVAVNANQASVKLLGNAALPSFANAKPGQVTIDTYVKQPAPSAAPASQPTPAPAQPAANQSAQSQGPTSEAGKVAETAYVGALGVGAGGGGYFLGKSMMSMIEQMGPLSLKNLGKQFGVAGVGMGLPFALVQDSFGYKEGKISAKRYWGNVASDALGWGVWGAGALAVGAALGGVGFIPVAAGLLAGGLLNSLSDHTIGRWLSNFVAKHIPAGLAKKGADTVVKYVTNPIDKYILGPIKRHLGVFLLTGGAAGIYFGLKGDGKEALKGVGAMAATMPGQMIGDSVLTKMAPFSPVQGVDLTPGKGQKFDPTDGSVHS